MEKIYDMNIKPWLMKNNVGLTCDIIYCRIIMLNSVDTYKKVYCKLYQFVCIMSKQPSAFIMSLVMYLDISIALWTIKPIVVIWDKNYTKVLK